MPNSLMNPLECVAALVLKDGILLAEERKLTKKVMPGAIALPGGHVEPGEELEDALRRELQEELGIIPIHPRYICTPLHRAVPRWEGSIGNHEAASLRWLPMTESRGLDLEVDRLAVAEYCRIYRDAGKSGEEGPP